MNHKAICGALFTLLLCAGCGSQIPDPPTVRSPEGTALQEDVPAAEDHVLLTLDAPLSDGRTLTLEAVGRVLNEYTCGVREVRVLDGDKLLQTVSAREAIEICWGEGMAEDFYDYTDSWQAEDAMEILDLNFDGNTDFGLFGWPANNTIPYYYWTWDADAGQYRYAFILQGAAVHPDTRELTSEYNSGPAGSQWVTEYYRPGEAGRLYLDRVEVRDWMLSEDNDRSGFEIYIPPESGRFFPGDSDWSWKTDLLLVYREIPTLEIHSDNTVAHFTEIWELENGQLRQIRREEYVYE